MAKKVGIGKQALLYIFNSKYYPGVSSITFTIDDLNQAIKSLGYEVQNKGSIVYDAGKRGGLPKEIIALGFNTLINKSSTYTFAYVEDSVVIFPDCEVKIIANKIDRELFLEIAPNGLVKADEQTFLSIINKHKILDDFLGVAVEHYVFHRRCSIPGIGQVEIDEIAFANIGRPTVIPVEAKGQNEQLTRSQIKSGIDYAQYKHPNLKICPIAIKLFSNGDIGVVETDLDAMPIRFARYNIDEQRKTKNKG